MPHAVQGVLTEFSTRLNASSTPVFDDNAIPIENGEIPAFVIEPVSEDIDPEDMADEDRRAFELTVTCLGKTRVESTDLLLEAEQLLSPKLTAILGTSVQHSLNATRFASRQAGESTIFESVATYTITYIVDRTNPAAL